jgi:hypothetical protein
VTARYVLSLLVAAVLMAAIGVPAAATAQSQEDEPSYRPPQRGAPGHRVGGATRGTFKVNAPLPTIELLAPSDHAGVAANPAPQLYFYASGPVYWPTQLTISAPGRPAPVLETAIPAPVAAGIYRLDLAQYHVRLEPGIIYTWSVSAILDPRNRARDIAASAALLLSSPDPPAAAAVAATQPVRRAALCARAGLWYDAVAAAVAAAPVDRYRALSALLRQVGLAGAAAFALAAR